MALSENEGAVQDVDYKALRPRLKKARQILDWQFAPSVGSEDTEPVYAAHAPAPPE